MEQSFDFLASDLANKSTALNFAIAIENDSDFLQAVSAELGFMKSLLISVLGYASEDSKQWTPLVEPTTAANYSTDKRLHLRGKLQNGVDDCDRLAEAIGVIRKRSPAVLDADIKEVANLLDEAAGALYSVKQRIMAVPDPAERMVDQEVGDIIQIASKKIKDQKSASTGGKRRKEVIPLPKAKLATSTKDHIKLEDDDAKSVQLDLDRDVTAGDGIFPERPVRGGWFRTAETKSPMLDGKLVPFARAASLPGIKWVTTSEAIYYNVAQTPQELLQVAVDQGFIPTQMFDLILSDGRFAPDDAPLSAGFSASIAPSKIEQKYIDAADLWYWWAQIEVCLRRANKESKIAFVNKWARRMFDLPTSLESAGAHAMEMLYVSVRRAIKNGDSINKCFYAFLSGNMANWKVGETRDAYVTRTQKSRTYFWGPYADVYTREWLKCPDAQFQIRPKADSWTKKTKKLLEKKRQEAHALAEIAAKTASNQASAARAALAQKAEEIESLNRNLTYRQAWIYWTGRATRAISRLDPFFRAAEQGAYTIDPNNKAVPIPKGGVLRSAVRLTLTAIFLPFWRLEETVTLVGEEVKPLLKFESRNWLSKLKDWWNSDTPSTTTDHSTWRTYAPIWATATTDAAYYGAASIKATFMRTVRRVGSMLHGSSQSDDWRQELASDLAAMPKAAWKTVAKNVVTLATTVAATALVFTTGLATIPQAFAFVTGFDMGYKIMTNFLSKRQAERADARDPQPADITVSQA